jgi:hypothetical protein
MPFPVNIRFINEAERKLGVKFPPSYVVHMVKSNGGELVTAMDDAWQLYPIFDTSDKTRLKRTCNDVVRQTMLARKRPQFPPDAVAIGSNGGSDELVFLRNQDAPELLAHEVYWWDHETGELSSVADDFADVR